jgi:hypothetical protein
MLPFKLGIVVLIALIALATSLDALAGLGAGGSRGFARGGRRGYQAMTPSTAAALLIPRVFPTSGGTTARLATLF